MNILIINQPPYNRGDESAHKGLVRTLLKRFPDAQIKVMHEVWHSESYRQYAVKDKRVEYFGVAGGCIKFSHLAIMMYIQITHGCGNGILHIDGWNVYINGQIL